MKLETVLEMVIRLPVDPTIYCNLSHNRNVTTDCGGCKGHRCHIIQAPNFIEEEIEAHRG